MAGINVSPPEGEVRQGCILSTIGLVLLIIALNASGMHFLLRLIIGVAGGVMALSIFGVISNNNQRAAALSFQRAVKDILVVHRETLHRKRRQLVRYDDYGNLLPQAWEAEKDYFIGNVVMPALAKGELSESERWQLHHLIDQVADSVPDSDGFSDVAAMDGAEYEHYCAHLLATGGWDTRVSPPGADQGIDIYAMKDGLKLVVQTKKYANSVGNDAVQQIIAGRVYAGADYAAVVSPAPFTKSAQELAATANVVLLHHDQLPSLAFQAQV